MAADIPITREDLARLDVAVVHYWLIGWRGGEKVVESILRLFPRADIYTLFADRQVVDSHLPGHRVYPSALNLPWLRRHYQKLFPLYPWAVRSLRLRKGYDLIISSESGPAKGIRHPPSTPHLCYIETPMRYCWGFTETYLDTLPRWSRPLARRMFRDLGRWDLTTVDNVDHYVANSHNVAGRVRKYYGREAAVCYPPVATELFDDELVPSSKEFYLSFGAITPYKGIDLLVETFNRRDDRLVIIGKGSERKRLESMAGPNIEFRGALPWSEVLDCMRRARALLFPGEEDFGIVPLEAMSQGIPVIALGKGGALETVCQNLEAPAESSGLFFDESTTESLAGALARFETIEEQFDPAWIREHARGFVEERFLDCVSEQVIELLNRKADDR